MIDQSGYIKKLTALKGALFATNKANR